MRCGKANMPPKVNLPPPSPFLARCRSPQLQLQQSDGPHGALARLAPSMVPRLCREAPPGMCIERVYTSRYLRVPFHVGSCFAVKLPWRYRLSLRIDGWIDIIETCEIGVPDKEGGREGWFLTNEIAGAQIIANLGFIVPDAPACR